MEFPESRYYRLNFVLLSLIGQNPYQSMASAIIIASVFFFCTVTAACIQIAKLVKEKFALQCVIDILPTMTMTMFCILYAPFAYANVKKFKRLLVSMILDWQKERPEEEKKIKDKFRNIGRLCAVGFTATVLLGATVVLATIFSTIILDAIIPLNESRPRRFVFEFEIFFDKQKYYYVLLAYEILGSGTILSLILSNEALALVCVQHACGKFAVIGYRLKNLRTFCKLAARNELHYRKIVIDSVIHCIQEHRDVLEFLSLLIDVLRLASSITLIGGVMVSSILVTTLLKPDLLSAKTLPLTVGMLIQIFLSCYVGQYVHDASLEIAEKSYSTVWYDFPLAAQKLLFMMILRSSKPCDMLINEFSVLSMKNFSIVMQTSMSYGIVFKQFL